MKAATIFERSDFVKIHPGDSFGIGEPPLILAIIHHLHMVELDLLILAFSAIAAMSPGSLGPFTLSVGLNLSAELQRCGFLHQIVNQAHAAMPRIGAVNLDKAPVSAIRLADLNSAFIVIGGRA